MADRSHGSRTPNVQERHSRSRNDLQQQNRPANQERLRPGDDHVDPARYQPNGVQGIGPPYDDFGRPVHQPNGVQGIGPPYDDFGRPVRPASHEHDDSSRDHSIRRSPYQASSGHGGGIPPRASNQGPHHASPEFDDGRPYQPVDRSSYRRQFDSGVGNYYPAEAPTAPRQDHDPMQRFRNETVRDQAWNRMHSYRPVSPPGGARGREQEPSHSAGTSLGAENGSSSSLGRPY